MAEKESDFTSFRRKMSDSDSLLISRKKARDEESKEESEGFFKTLEGQRRGVSSGGQ